MGTLWISAETADATASKTCDWRMFAIRGNTTRGAFKVATEMLVVIIGSTEKPLIRRKL